MLRSGDVLILVYQCRHVGPPPLMGHPVGYRFEHPFERFTRVVELVTELDQLGQVDGDMAFVPSDQDRFDVGEVLVQRRPSDPGLLGDLRHRHRRQPVLGHQRSRGVQRGVAHRSAVRLDRVVPELRHRINYTLCSRGDSLI